MNEVRHYTRAEQTQALKLFGIPASRGGQFPRGSLEASPRAFEILQFEERRFPAANVAPSSPLEKSGVGQALA